MTPPDRDVDPDEGFWTQRPELEHLRAFARSRRAAPYATLACVLRRATSCIEPNVVLPPTVGGIVSVNLFTASAGRSGQGKGAADAAGFDCINLCDHNSDSLDAHRPNAGSGEGLARLFKGRGKDEPGITRAHLIVPEVGTLAALAGRQGGTLPSELLKAYMGEPLGFTNSSRETTTAIEAHAYRLCLGVGVQPENAGFFLEREKDGFPQRFQWVSTIDPYAPEERPDPVDPIDIKVPDFGRDRYVVPIPDEARQEIDEHRRLVLIGSQDVDPLDGHLMLTRLKIAFALAVLSQRKEIDESDWKLAGELTDMSQRVRSDIKLLLAEKHRRENAAKAHDQADREEIVRERLTEKTHARVLNAIENKLRRVEIATRGDLERACRKDIRDEFDYVFETLLEAGFIVESERGEGRAERFEFGPDLRE
ncbi:hypothetical protein [Rhodococcus sp. SJ-2]